MDLNLFDLLQGPVPIPPPFEIPAPGSGPIDVSSIWEYDNLYDMVRAFRTSIAFANQNLVLQIFIGLGLVSMAVRWLLTGGRDDGDQAADSGPDEQALAEAVRNEV